MNYLKVNGSDMMYGNLNMNENKIINILDPTNEQDCVNKRYLESQLDYLKRNGSKDMTFNLNMNNHKIINLKNYDSNNANDSDVPNIKYVKDEISKLSSIDTSNFLKKDGSIQMEGNLNLNNHKITDSRLPSNNQDLTNKKYVDDEIKKHLKKHLILRKKMNSNI